jgi:hypothetical protein
MMRFLNFVILYLKKNTVFGKLELCPFSVHEMRTPLAMHFQEHRHNLKDGFENIGWLSKLKNKVTGWVGMQPGI